MRVSESNIHKIQVALEQTSQSIQSGEKKYLLISESGNQVAVKPKSEIEDLSKLDTMKRITLFVKEKLAGILSKDPLKDDLKLATFSDVSDLVEGLLNSKGIARLEKLKILDQYETIAKVYKTKERSLLEQLFFFVSNQSQRADKIIEQGREKYELLTEEELKAQKAAELERAHELKKKSDELNEQGIPSWLHDDFSNQTKEIHPIKVINNHIYEGVADNQGGFKGKIHFHDYKNRLTTIDNGFFKEDRLEGQGKREEMHNLLRRGRGDVHIRISYEGTFKNGEFVKGKVSISDSNGNETSLINYPFPSKSDSLEILGLNKSAFSEEELKEIKFIFDSGIQGYIQP